MISYCHLSVPVDSPRENASVARSVPGRQSGWVFLLEHDLVRKPRDFTV